MGIIDRINAELTRQGKTGADLSRALGLSNSIYSQWNTGKVKPSKKNLGRIANYLGVSVDYLLGNEETPTPEGEREITFDDFTYAMYDEAKDLPPEKKQMLLEMARFMKADLEKDKK